MNTVVYLLYNNSINSLYKISPLAGHVSDQKLLYHRRKYDQFTYLPLTDKLDCNIFWKNS